jgi:predicted nucleic acid-binding protein
VLVEEAVAVRVGVAEVLVEHGVRTLTLAVAQGEAATQLALLEPTTHLAVVTVVAEAGLAHRLEQAAREESLEAVAVVEQVQVAAVRHQAVTAAQGVVLKLGCGFTDERNN